jgi:hypothetical protein
MYPHKENFIEDMREFIDFSDNEDLKKEADDMSGLGQCVFTDGEKIGEAKGIVRSGIKHGDSENDILKDLQEALNVSLQQAKAYLDMYGGKTV